MSQAARPGGRRPELAIVGLASGLITIHPRLRSLEYMFSGLWFGLSLALYFCLVERKLLVGKTMVMTLASALALYLAVWSTLFGDSLFRRIVDVSPPSFESESFLRISLMGWFTGGAVGGFVISGTTFLLYGPFRKVMLAKLFVCTVGGGLLGVAGYLLGTAPPFGPVPRAAVFSRVLFPVWQAGMGGLMGLVWNRPTVRPV